MCNVGDTQKKRESTERIEEICKEIIKTRNGNLTILKEE